MTGIEYQTKASRDSSRWETTTAVKIWKRDSITKMKRKKARNKITCRAQSEGPNVKETGESLSHPTPMSGQKGSQNKDIVAAYIINN